MRSLRHPEYRAHLSERFGRLPADLAARLAQLPRRPVWMQAVSVGEVGVARALIQAAHGIPFVLSSTTPAGRDAAASLRLADLIGVFHFPIDWSPFTRRTLDSVLPAAFVSVETEIWPGLMARCARRGVAVAIVNGRLSARSHDRYRRVRGLLRGALSSVRIACMQTADDADRAASIGIPSDRIVVTGNMKFDMAASADRDGDVAASFGLPAGSKRPVLVAGSTSPGEEEQILDAVARMGLPDLLLILAPRHRERFDEVAGLLTSRGITFVRRSRMSGAPPVPRSVILLDTLGELAGAYALATVAFVGGSLVARGGQNMIEPAARGVPVLVGPHTQHFQSVVRDLLACGAAVRVHGAQDLAREARRFIDDPVARARAGEAGLALVTAHRGATGRTLERVLPFLG
ncbi:MAG: 3-deoxy-D-manno-octulosonic acid transferase [Candidatus Polarisedimenticolia bacterium]